MLTRGTSRSSKICVYIVDKGVVYMSSGVVIDEASSDTGQWVQETRPKEGLFSWRVPVCDPYHIQLCVQRDDTFERGMLVMLIDL